MKNILVISDTHGNIENLYNIMEEEKIDYIIHLGDDQEDYIKIQNKYKNIKSWYIVGNSDMEWLEPKEQLFEIYGTKIYAVHGHTYNTKLGYAEILERAKELNAKIVLFGHSHIQKCLEKDNILLINPGSLSIPRENNIKFSYTIINIDENKINIISKWQEEEKLLGVEVNTVRLEDYNPKYKELFEKEKKHLINLLGDNIEQIEHVGSTALIGIKSKPIIDIVVAIKDIGKIDQIIEIMDNAGYSYRAEDDRHKFIKGEGRIQSYHVYITTLDNYTWIERVRFRDYMLLHPDDLKKYEEIKIKLATVYSDDRKSYVKSKREFINKIHKKAKEYFENKK